MTTFTDTPHTQREKHPEPSFVNIGFQPNNRWGGWWYREPNDRYTIQIVPANIFDPTHDERSWWLGIAHRGPMKWGLMVFPAPEAAALHACRVVNDDDLLNHITTAMQANYDNYQQRIKRTINTLMRRKS